MSFFVHLWWHSGGLVSKLVNCRVKLLALSRGTNFAKSGVSADCRIIDFRNLCRNSDFHHCVFRHKFRKSIFRQSAETPLLAKLVPRDSASNFTRQLTNLETSPPECHHKCTKKDKQTNITNRIPRIKIRIKG